MGNYIFCCDWGTTFFRLRLVDGSNFKVIAEVQSPDGVSRTFKKWQDQNEIGRFDFYTQKLKAKIQEVAERLGVELSHVPVVISGMASSSIGMEEIPYASLPFAVNGSQVSVKIFENSNVLSNPVILVSGIKDQDDAMRGEETQLIGLFNLKEVAFRDSGEAVFVFPGTHSKHIYVRNGFITHFSTFMTGEIFNLLSEYSILKDSLALSVSGLKDSANRFAFKRGVEVSCSLPILHSLFTVRTGHLFKKLTKGQNAFYLSGLLIGAEITYLNGNDLPVIVCCGKNLFDHYKLAVEGIGLTTRVKFIEPDLIDKAATEGQMQILKALNIFL